MNAPTPRFLDDGGQPHFRRVPPEPVQEPVAPPPESLLRQPAATLLEPEPDAPARIDSGWQPPAIVAERSPMGSAGYAAIGFGVLAATWFLVGIGRFAASQFEVSNGFGWSVLAIETLGTGLVGVAGWREWRSIRRLRQAEHLRVTLGGNTGLDRVRAEARTWLASVAPRLSQAGCRSMRRWPAAPATRKCAPSCATRWHRIWSRRQGGSGSRRRSRVRRSWRSIRTARGTASRSASAGLRAIRRVAAIYGLAAGPRGHLGAAARHRPDGRRDRGSRPPGSGGNRTDDGDAGPVAAIQGCPRQQHSRHPPASSGAGRSPEPAAHFPSRAGPGVLPPAGTGAGPGLRLLEWCPGEELNHRHCNFQSHALPTELPGHRALGDSPTKPDRSSHSGTLKPRPSSVSVEGTR